MRASTWSPRLPLAAAIVISLVAATAEGRSTGIIGVSGIDGFACEGCHVDEPGVSVPEVRFEGPAAVDPDSTSTYRFVVTSMAPDTLKEAGLDVAATGGALVLVAGQGAKLQTDRISGRTELTHTAPKMIDVANQAGWEFQWQAPATPGLYVLWGAGNSVNGSLTEEGDANAVTMLVIAVGDVPATATATPTVTPTATAGASCAGDCNGDGAVAVNELVSSVNIALGSAPVTACPACDANHDGTVSVNELVSAVARALNGCPPA